MSSVRIDVARLSGEVSKLVPNATVNRYCLTRLANRISKIASVVIKDDSRRIVLSPDEAESHQQALREFHSLLEGVQDYLTIFSQDIQNVAPILGPENVRSDFDAFGDRLRRLLPRLVLALRDEEKTEIVEEFSENKMKKEDEEDARADRGDVDNTPVEPGGVEGQQPGGGNVVASEYGRPVCAAQDNPPFISIEDLHFSPVPENEIQGSERSELGSVYRGAYMNTPVAIKKLHVRDGGPHYDRQDSQTSAMDLRSEAEVLMKFQSENVAATSW
ncbi:uncharacterized protein LOC118418093 [Branchiostoma floridae]|uniref:Uncharacterized protein LOC118418093 n=1 Tax=Branchiostoma floridae TaxID=7739 RepID=A0A9J7LD48_BRAFL|nr:uncharacterized protein LOC118418093 [Branchiostoma floridae]